jgi:hypothetical protein
MPRCPIRYKHNTKSFTVVGGIPDAKLGREVTGLPLVLPLLPKMGHPVFWVFFYLLLLFWNFFLLCWGLPDWISTWPGFMLSSRGINLCAGEMQSGSKLPAVNFGGHLGRACALFFRRYLGCVWFRVQTEPNRQKLASLNNMKIFVKLSARKCWKKNNGQKITCYYKTGQAWKCPLFFYRTLID